MRKELESESLEVSEKESKDVINDEYSFLNDATGKIEKAEKMIGSADR